MEHVPQSPDIGKVTQAQKNAEKKAKKQAKAAQHAAANGTAVAAVTFVSLMDTVVHCIRRSCTVCGAYKSNRVDDRKVLIDLPADVHMV